MDYRYFSENDFLNAVPSCELEKMDIGFMHKLDTARHIAGIPFIVNSGFRTVEWEKSKGRSGRSSHTIGLAVDIKCSNSYDRLLIVKALLYVGFKRIGIYDSFIHVDGDNFKVDSIYLG